MSSTTLPVCPKTGSISPSLTVHLCLHTAPGNRECAPENVPLREDVESFFEREVKPHVPDAWIDTTRRDPQDGEVGLVGYEINFNRYFYEYRPPRPLKEIEADIQQVEKEIVAMLREIAG